MERYFGLINNVFLALILRKDNILSLCKKNFTKKQCIFYVLTVDKFNLLKC